MKKRLLITSIVMMLVVAVALSTATYAWFTSNATVTASTISMTAASNTADSIYIKWEGGQYNDAITTTKSYGADVLIPMIPNQIESNTTTLGFSTATNNISFKTAGITTAAGDSVFTDVTAAEGVYFMSNTTDTPASANTIWIKNTSPANIVNNIKVTATITPTYIACTSGELAVSGYTYYERTGESPNYSYSAYETQPSVGTAVAAGAYKATVELVRIAIFTRDLTELGTDDNTTAYTLRGILANTANAATYFGTIEDNNSQSAFHNSTGAFANNTVQATGASTGFKICYDGSSLHTLKAGGEVSIKVLMWLDGEALNDSTQGAIANVALSFEATRS